MLRNAGQAGCRALRVSSGIRLACSPIATARRRPVSGLANVALFRSKTFHNRKQLNQAWRFSPRMAAMTVGEAGTRSFSSRGRAADLKDRNRKVAIYMASVVAAVLGVSYAAVPLYKVFCQVTGFGGTTQIADAEKAMKMKPVDGGRMIRVTFDGGTADTMPWKFRPTQSDVKVVPGETALAFFSAKNPTRKHITGVATYNVFPLKAGIYFNKIQCFCFEEQRLRAGEEIDMPVFFFLDPEMLDDPTMDNVNNVTLSYTFFKTAEEDAQEEQEQEEEEEEEEEGNSVDAQ